jgi:hypothetical protein
LFLLDPDKKITKVTRETCSKGGIEQLMQKGCGPPQPGNRDLTILGWQQLPIQ